MNDIIERDIDMADAFQEMPTGSAALQAPASQTIINQERSFGAQKVAVYRDEARVMQKIKSLAAAVGEDWYYRFPVKDKGRTVYVEGPSIKLANDIARIYGNCEVDTRVQDSGEVWIIYARFTDYESGFVMTRPFQQRKSQSSLRGDADRARDIAFQIGVSKAIRNVVVNSLQTMADYGFREARNALVVQIGKDLAKYRDRCAGRLAEEGIVLKRVEAARGKPISEWLAPDVAMTIAEIKAIADGMATANETYPATVAQDADAGPKDLKGKMDDLAAGDEGKESRDSGKAEPEKSDPKTAKPKGEAKTDEKSPDKSADKSAEADRRQQGDNPDDGASQTDPVDEVDAAAAGREAREKNMARKSMPAKFRNDERLQAAWLDGYDNPADTSQPEEGPGDGA